MTDRLASHGVQELLKQLQRLSVNEIDDMLQDAKTPEPAPGDLVWYEDVEALLRTLLIPQEDWQPIATAPKDQWVIGALIEKETIWRVHEMKHNGLAFYTKAGGSLPKMTHWMPLPTHPKESA